jgi:hypothetical protein
MNFFRFITEEPPEPMDSSPITSPSMPTPPLSTCTITPPIESKSTSVPPTNETKKEEANNDNNDNNDKPSSPEHIRHTPFTAPWVAARLQDTNLPRAVAILRTWAHSKRHREVNEELVQEINKLEKKTIIPILEELQQPRVFIHGTKGSKLSIKTTIQTVDTHTDHQAIALIDSGCEGSCIDIKFVRDHSMNTVKLPRMVPVLNADGTPNESGPISEIVTVQLHIGEHVERIDLGVTNLGKGEIFLGHDWLKLHDPTISWRNGEIEFNHCPSHCQSKPSSLPPEISICRTDFNFENPEEVEETIHDPAIDIQDDDQLLLIDTTPAIQIRAKTGVSMELAIKEHQKKEAKPWTEIVPEYLHDYEDVFTKKDFDELPPHRPWDHAIELVSGADTHLDCKIYPLSLDEQKQLDEFLDEQLSTGRIRPSKSPMASPFFFVKKKDGKLRPVQDYRKLNDMTVKNRYPLPLITELIDSLQNAKYFTKLDVRWGYNNIRIKEGDEHKAAFRTNRGLFEPLVMFFGLTNSPATFQTMMNDIFRIEIRDGHVLIYLDDILIFDQELDTHRHRVRQVMDRLREHKLYLKPEKCEFEVQEVEYLGVIVSHGQVRMDPVKVTGVTEWPEPECKTDVQSFLGFCNFYRRFIHHFADIA